MAGGTPRTTILGANGLCEYKGPVVDIQSNANNLPVGKWVKSYSSTWSNMPNNVTLGTWLIDVNSMGAAITQTAREISTATLYYRAKVNDSWGVWAQV